MTTQQTTPVINATETPDRLNAAYQEYVKWSNLARKPNMVDLFNKFRENNTRVILVEIGNDLWETYINNIPADVRQHYTCMSCKSAYNGFMRLGILGDDLKITPLMLETDPEKYSVYATDAMATAHEALLAEFEKPKNVRIITEKDTKVNLGKSSHGGFNHFAADELAEYWNDIVACYAPRHADTGYGSAEIKLIHETFNKYLSLLDRVLPIPDNHIRVGDRQSYNIFQNHLKQYKETENRSLFVIRYLASFGLNIVRLKNELIGVVLDAMLENRSAKSIADEYARLSDPTVYARKVALPSDKEMEASIKFLEDNGYAEKLQQRVATVEEVKPSLIWAQEVKLTSQFDKLRNSVKTEEQAKALTYPLELVSIQYFNTQLNKLIESGELKSVAYASVTNRFGGGLYLNNFAENAETIFKDKQAIRSIFWNNPVNLNGEVTFDPREVFGITKTKAAHGDQDIMGLVFDGTISERVTGLNFVNDLIDELRPHQRVIDNYSHGNVLNKVTNDGRACALNNVAIIVPLTVNKQATISLMTDKVVYEYTIVSQR